MDPHNATHNHSFSFTVTAAEASVPIVFGELRSILEFATSDDESELLFAITEIAHNAVSAQGDDDSPLEVAVTGLPPIVLITDHAGGFTEPPSLTSPSCNATSGRRLLLARAFVPDPEIVATDDGTTVEIPMRLTTNYRNLPPHSDHLHSTTV